MISPQDALERLQEGNRRFASGGAGRHEGASPARRLELVSAQRPLAAILGCADSRVPPELIFDQGLGDLFVVRVAGNIAASAQVGSIEFAAVQFGVRLVVVLGHTDCGAVLATLEAVRAAGEPASENLGVIVDHIRTVVATLPAGELHGRPGALLAETISANVRAGTDVLRSGSKILGPLIRHEGLLVVGAVYSIETGTVDFFDLPPAG